MQTRITYEIPREQYKKYLEQFQTTDNIIAFLNEISSLEGQITQLIIIG